MIKVELPRAEMIDRVDTNTSDLATLLWESYNGVIGAATQNIPCPAVAGLSGDGFEAILPNEDPVENLHVNPRMIPASP